MSLYLGQLFFYATPPGEILRSSLKINVPGIHRIVMAAVSDAEKKEVYLEADKEIPGQHYVCLSFISPNKVLADKNLFFFSEFMKDYAIQYKIKATEAFVMAQMAKMQETLSKAQDVLENAVTKAGVDAGEDLSGALAHVKENMSDFKETTIEDDYGAFMFKHKKRLEDAFFEKNAFRTTVQGLKVRGSYDTQAEAVARAKTLQKIDPSFDVYVGQVGFWLPWDPQPHEVADQEYADEQLNQLMKKYKENEATRDALYAEEKISRTGAPKSRGVLSGAPIAGGGAGASASSSEMFGGEDLAIARKRDASAGASATS
jgi:hypothetical protein